MGQLEDTIEERANWHWRNSMRPVRFLNIDARAAIPFALLLVYFRPITVFFTVVSTVLFIALEKRGLTFPSALRAFRSWLNGQSRPAWVSRRRRRFVDFG
ncbi:MAG TPA: IcmT/TraK family protein [Alphaproteobacteria bacterium]|nr:IcmT/TraK family protein [Alphaproteobacteria bacterium]